MNNETLICLDGYCIMWNKCFSWRLHWSNWIHWSSWSNRCNWLYGCNWCNWFCCSLSQTTSCTSNISRMSRLF